MKFSAIHPLTLLDYPGYSATILFTPGCNFRCHYCHNSEFVLPEKLKVIAHNFIPEEKILSFLKRRKGLVEGVCITGGEPTIHPDLPDFIEKVCDLDFLVKLDTNGSNPDMLKKLLQKNLIHYIAMDVKSITGKSSFFEESQNIKIMEKSSNNFFGTPINMDLLEQSKKSILQSGKKYEFRTTLVREFHTEKEFLGILKFLRGAEKYFLQNFQSRGGCLNPQWEQYSGFSRDELAIYQKKAEEYVACCRIRE
jgi:pyruvate formate lyase activating enzyme